MALTEWEQKERAAIDLYAGLYDGPKVRGALYTSAWLLYQKNHFAAASERFTRVILLEPGSPEAEQAAELVMDGLALVEDWEGLRERARTY